MNTPPQIDVSPQPESVLGSWAAELEGLDPRSHEYKETLGILTQLAVESGMAGFELASGADQEEQDPPPPGFTRREKLAGPARLPGDQFADTVSTLANTDHSVEVVEYTTDLGKKIRVCDLRPATRASLKGALPQTEAEQARLDDAFLRDAKILADTGTPRNSVTSVSGVYYTKVSSTKLRSYWMPVRDEGHTEGVRTVARVGDCGNGVNYESMLHRRLFGSKL